MTLLKDIKIYFKMLFSYKPSTFWNDLLTNSFDLRGVGHYRLSNKENQKMYEKKKEIIVNELNKCGIKIDGSMDILEIGCGVGYWTEFFKQLGVKHYTGNDIAEISVKKLSEQYKEYLFIQGDISEIPLPKDTFDIALMIDVTQHITDDEKFIKAIANIWSSVKHEGYFIVTIWDPAKNVYMTNKLRLNRIEKPRGLEWYNKAAGEELDVISKADFNDKYLLILKKHSA
jgi:SAM-dependent methyltransferase